MARPAAALKKIEDRKQEFDRFMQWYPGKTEMAGIFDVSESTLDRFCRKTYKVSFEELREKSFGKTRMALRRKQIEQALKGNNTMLIWCGKQFLGQTEHTHHTLDPSELRNLQVNWKDEQDDASSEVTTSQTSYEAKDPSSKAH